MKMIKLSSAATASLFIRYAPLLSLLVPFVVSVALLSTRHLLAYGPARNYVEEHRTTISVIIQVFSSFMGILQTTTATMLINYGTRIQLASSSTQLDTVGLLTALSVPRIPWNLPAASLVCAIFMTALAQGPGALWAGAITPVTVQKARDIGSIQVPQFTSATRNVWDSEFWREDNGNVWNFINNCTEQRGEVTSVSNCPVPNHQAVLLDAARVASTSGPRNHSKPDNPTWTYQGRSYGVGSSPGLQAAQGVPPHYTLLGYAYNETGYLASAACQRNTSANVTFQFSDNVDNVDIWEITGRLPNSISDEWYPVMAWHRDDRDEAAVLAWAAVSDNNTGSHMVGIVASALYGSFSHLQCNLTFSPTAFSVRANVSTQTIIVSPNDDTTAVDLDPTGHLQSNAVWSLNLLSRMSTSLYVSVLGEALAYNLHTLTPQANSAVDDASMFSAAEDSFVAMLDDALSIYGAAQLVLANSSTPAPIAGAFEAVRFGQPRYQWGVVAVNLTLLALVLAEGARTRWWRGLPLFDPLVDGVCFDVHNFCECYAAAVIVTR